VSLVSGPARRSTACIAAEDPADLLRWPAVGEVLASNAGMSARRPLLDARKRPNRRKSHAASRSWIAAVRAALFKGRPWWQDTLLVIGIVTVVTFVAVSFLGTDGMPDRIVVSDDLGPVDSPRFTTAVSRLVGAAVESGGTITVLNNGDAFRHSLLDTLRQAQSTINFSVFMWQTGTFSDQVLDALIERQRAGVQVRVLLDALAATGAWDRKFDALSEAGGQVAKFRSPRVGTWTRVHRRNHRRAIVVDGRVGYTGGMAVNDKWLGHAQDPDHWRDMMFRLTGPLASSLQAAFADVWIASTGELLAGARMYPADVGPEAAGVSRFIHLVFSPADDDQSMAYFFLAAVLAARERLWIVTPYFIPDRPLRDALRERARAGVDVRLLLPGPHIDNPQVRWSGQNHYDTLMESGVRIFEYQPTVLHTKFLVADGKWSILGSPNINPRSRRLDEENAFGILDARLASELEAAFEADLARSVEIDLRQWRQRSVFKRLLEMAVRVLDQQS
jgi:cardiolipin synthase